MAMDGFLSHKPAHEPWTWAKKPAPAWQAFVTAVMAVAGLALWWGLWPAAFNFMVEMLTTAIHEGGHALAGLATGAEVKQIVINADGSGHVLTSSDSPFKSAVISTAGPLAPALLGALLTFMGLTRKALSMLLVTAGAGLALVGWLQTGGAADAGWLDARLALFIWAALMLAIGFAPAPAMIKSVAVLMLALIAIIALVQGYAYLSVTYIDGDPARPSDVQSIADTLGAGNRDIARALLGLMALPWLLSLIFTLNWFQKRDSSPALRLGLSAS